MITRTESKMADTRRYGKCNAVAVHRNPEVLMRLTGILDHTPVKIRTVQVDEKVQSDISSRLSGQKLYFLPFESHKTNGGISKYESELARGSDVIFLTDKSLSDTDFNSLKVLPNDKIFYGYLSTPALANAEYSDFLKRFVFHLAFDTPRNVLLFSPEGYGDVKSRLESHFSLKGLNTHVDSAGSLEQALRKASLHSYYDRIYIPESFLPDLSRFTERSRAWPFFVNNRNPVYGMTDVVPDKSS